MTDNNNNSVAAAAAAGASGFQATSLYVGDLDTDVTEAQLMEKFATVGSVTLVRICRDKITRQSLGYAYVNFSQPSEAERALDTLNFELINNKPMRIMWSQRDPALRRSGIGNVFIKNLDKSIDNKSLYDTFSTFGNIISCKIMGDETGSKGYGFVHFETQEAAEKAIQSVHNMLLNGKIVHVSHFISKFNRPTSQEAVAKFTNLYVKNFDESVDEAALRELFGKYGEITSIKIAKTPDDKSAGFGFVNFTKPEDAALALEKLNDYEWNKKKLYVSKFEKRSDRASNIRKALDERKMEQMKKYYGINLYVKNLDDRIDTERLIKDFSPFGKITSAKVMTENGRSKGFGFVCYSTPEEANRAVAEMNGRIVGTKPLYIALAQRKEDRRKILAAQFRERLQNSQYLLQNAINQAANTNLFYQYQAGGPGAGGMRYYSNAQAAPVGLLNPANVRAAVPRWPVNNNYQTRPNIYAQQQQQQQQQQIYYMDPSQQNRMRHHNKMYNQQQDPMKNYNKFSNYAINLSANEPLNPASLAAADPKSQKQIIGERLYPLIQNMNPELAGKITGMLLEIDNSELLHMLDSPDALKSRVDEAIFVLQSHNKGQTPAQAQAQASK